jgi:hypothetical protein
LITLIYAYAAIPGDINFGRAIFFGLVPAQVSKAVFFFSVLIGAAMVNLFFLGFVSGYKKSWEIASKENPINLSHLPAWLYGMAGLINLLLITGIFYVGFTNSAEEVVITNFAIVIAAVPVLIVIWLLYLPFLLKAPQEA